MMFGQLSDNLRSELGVVLDYIEGTKPNGTFTHGMLYKIPFLAELDE